MHYVPFLSWESIGRGLWVCLIEGRKFGVHRRIFASASVFVCSKQKPEYSDTGEKEFAAIHCRLAFFALGRCIGCTSSKKFFRCLFGLMWERFKS